MNLNVIIENNNRRKNNNSLFDKLWYQKREESKIKLNSGVKVGFVFDGQGFITNSSSFIKLYEDEYKESIV